MKVLTLVAVAAAALALTGCSSDDPTVESEGLGDVGNADGGIPGVGEAPANDPGATDGDDDGDDVADVDDEFDERYQNDPESIDPAEQGLWSPERPDGVDTIAWWQDSIEKIWLPGDIPNLPSNSEIIELWVDPANTDLDDDLAEQLREDAEELAYAEFTGGWEGVEAWPTIWDVSKMRREPPVYPGFEVHAVQVGSMSPEHDGWAYAGVIWEADEDPYRSDGSRPGLGLRVYAFEVADDRWVPRPCYDVPEDAPARCHVPIFTG